jgi:hypothetical protein
MNISPVGNRAQEAMETAAQTRAEAAQGDIQAKVKLAQIVKLQAQVQPPATATVKAPADSAAEVAPSVPPPPTGVVLNVKR